MKKLVLLALCCMAFLAFLTEGAWGVPGVPFCVSTAADLQNALNTAASDGQDDFIMVVQGTYTGNFFFSSSEGKNIYLYGGYTAGCGSRVADPSLTVLDGGGYYLRVLDLEDNDGGGVIEVDGFTLQHGGGGGVLAWSRNISTTGNINAGAVTITNNIVTENGGGPSSSSCGVFAQSYSYVGTAGTVTLLNNIITGNSATNGGGGGVYADSSSGSGTAGNITLLNNTITGNNTGSYGYGGGVYAYSLSYSGTAGTITLTNNTITGNHGNYGGGAYFYFSSGTVNCYNNIIWGNTASDGADIELSGSGAANGYNNDYTNMYGSWTSEGGSIINADPLFVDPAHGDYHLQPLSPCIDKGLNTAPNIPSTDFEGDTRIIDGDKNGTATVDIGADEYNFVSYSCVNNATDLQNALDQAATDGQNDVIKVVQGTYSENFTYNSSEGYSITLLGGYKAGCASRVVDPANTILDGLGKEKVLSLYITDGGSDIEVDGFTLRHGVSTGSGAGVFAISDNMSATGYMDSGSITITNNIVTENSSTTTNGGGGVFADSYSSHGAAGAITFSNNVVSNNACTEGFGGGVYAQSYSSSSAAGTVTLLNNTVTANSANYGGGASLSGYGPSGGGNVNCYNNIIWGNTASTGGDIYLWGSALIGYNNDYTDMYGSSWTSEGGNITADPLFVDPAHGDYHLRPLSPCIDAGLNSAPGIPAQDFEGDARIIDGDNDGIAFVDMGADEYNGTMFAGCSLINKYQPSFKLTDLVGPFKSFTIFFSTSSTDFLTKGVLIKKANIKGTMSSYIPSSGVWKKLFTAAWNGGVIRDIYWKVMGTRTDKSTVSSAVWNVSIDVPLPPVIQSPIEGALLPAATPPTFIFDTMCNIKFRLEISSLGDFSDPKKIKAFTYTIKNPNATNYLSKTLSSSQWKAVQKLITGTGYFRIRAWDGIKRETSSETRSFTISP